MTETDLTAEDVTPTVEQVGARIDDLTHEQAVETVSMMLDVELDADDADETIASESPSATADETAENSASATTDAEPHDEPQETVHSEETAGVSSDERLPLPAGDDPSPSEGDAESSTSDARDDEPSLPVTRPQSAIVPVDVTDDDGSSPEIVTDESDTSDPATAPCEADEDTAETESTPVEDHPLIDPIAGMIAEQTSVSRQQARTTTARLLPAFEDPSYPLVLEAVADELDVKDALEESPPVDGTDSDQNEGTRSGSTHHSSRADNPSRDAYWK